MARNTVTSVVRPYDRMAARRRISPEAARISLPAGISLPVVFSVHRKMVIRLQRKARNPKLQASVFPLD